MAYNPFNIFRRNQRAIFAVITVFIMFTFVLSSGLSGGADFFDWLPRWLGQTTRRGDHICTIDGKTVYDRDLSEVRRQRVIANEFMALAADQALENLHRHLTDLTGQISPKFKLEYQMALQNPFGGGAAAARMAADPEARPVDKDAAQGLTTLSNLIQSRFQVRMTGSYFPTPNRTARDLVEFMLWDRKAQEMGIRFSQDEVRKLLAREFHGQFKNDVPVREALQHKIQGFNLDLALTALAAEFRVRTAQTALLGEDPANDMMAMFGMGGGGGGTLPGRTPPVFSPAYDLFDFYRERSSPTTYQVLAVPAANFVAQVSGTPTDDELQRLYHDHKENEPNPSREQPGFKEPRKIKLEWVSVTGTEPYYVKLAEEQLSKRPVAAAMIVPDVGVWAAVTSAPFAASDPVLRRQYQTQIADPHKLRVGYRWGGPSTFVLPSDVLDTSVVQPQNLAAAAGGGVLAGVGNGFAPATLLQSATIASEQRARVKAGAPLFLPVGAGPGLLPVTVGAEATYRAALPGPLPYEVVRPELAKEMLDNKARELAVKDLEKLRDDLNKMTETGKTKDQAKLAAAKAHVAEFVKARGIKTGASADFHGLWTIAEDPGLAPLKELLEKGGRGTTPGEFGRPFFVAQDQRTGAQVPTTGLYTPAFFPHPPGPADMTASTVGKPDPVFLTWRTDEQKERSVPFTQAKPKVEEAWRRMKARELAKAEADRLADEVRNLPATSPDQIDQKLRDLHAALEARAGADPKAKERVRLFKFENVAPLPITNSPTGAGGGFVSRFDIPASKDVPFPTDDMKKVLIDERTKPMKTVLVLPDAPKDTFYVAVLRNRDEKKVDDYKNDVLGPSPMNMVRETMRAGYRSESYRKTRETVLGLIKQEFNYTETDDQKKKLDEREKRGED